MARLAKREEKERKRRKRKKKHRDSGGKHNRKGRCGQAFPIFLFQQLFPLIKPLV